eukprot:symbB.v1.2.003433.t1/scaffold195.1/size274553/4
MTSNSLALLLAACAAVAIFPSTFITPRQGKQSSHVPSIVTLSNHKPLAAVTPEEHVSSQGLSLGLMLAAVALAGRSYSSGGNNKAKNKGLRCVTLQATKQTTAEATKKEEKQELAKKSEVPADLDWSQVSSQWEVDCFSRPINREGKKMWEHPQDCQMRSLQGQQQAPAPMVDGRCLIHIWKLKPLKLVWLQDH